MNNLKLLRTEKHLTMRELADKVGICYTTISSLETGKRPFNLDHLQRLSKFFGVSYDYILGTSDERKNKVVFTDVTQDGKITKIQMEFLIRVEDLNVKDMEQVFDYIDFLKSKGSK